MVTAASILSVFCDYVATTSCSHQQALITFSDFTRDLLVIAEWWPSSAPHYHIAPSRGDGVIDTENTLQKVSTSLSEGC